MDRKRMSTLQKGLVAGAIIITVIIASLALLRGWGGNQRPPGSSDSTTTITPGNLRTIAADIATPWAIDFLPSGDLLVTERSGQVQRIGQNGATYNIEGVRETSEGGLLGIALHPDFADNRYVYLYSTTDSGGRLANRIERYRLEGQVFRDRTEVLADIPASANHDGGALAFGPDDKLYITTGDAGDEPLAQDPQSLAGKILRLNPDGSVPSDNPFGNAVWSYGHRNPQGLTWDNSGRLWSTEHGPSGLQSGRDELNLIARGANYGWPTITGDETRDGMRAPILHSGDNDTWAPGGLAYAEGSLYFAGLRGQTLYQAKINSNDSVTLSRHFVEQYGRLRAVTIRNDELYFSTSNRDGRGSPAENDDHIYAVPLRALSE